MKSSLTSTQKVESNTVWDRLIALAPPDKTEEAMQQIRAPRITHSSRRLYTQKPISFGQNHLGRGCPDD